MIRWVPDDVDTRWDRAVLMTEMGDFRKASAEFEKLHAERPADAEVAKMLARVRESLGLEVLEGLRSRRRHQNARG